MAFTLQESLSRCMFVLCTWQCSAVDYLKHDSTFDSCGRWRHLSTPPNRSKIVRQSYRIGFVE